MTPDPSLTFWLQAAEARGALVEDRGDVALAIVPDALQRELGIAEEVAVTADPEAAREEGAVLLLPGEPLLERMITSVLARGDVGCVHLPWPPAPPPGPTALLERARDLVPVDHGRIDPGGPPAPLYAGVLRVAGLVTYDISSQHRFRETQEVWVDAGTGTPVGVGDREVLRSSNLNPGVPADHPVLAPDLEVAVRGANALIGAVSEARCRDLAAEAAADIAEQVATVRARHRAALEAIARRRADTPAERQRSLDEREQELRSEHDVRVRELEEGLAVTHRVTPFRIHLVLVPALALPVEVRRGGRRYPFSLTWLVPSSSFAPSRCPSCGTAAVLAAGRDRLGCRVCTGDVAGGAG